jgi:hypothetical protein
MMAMLTKWHTDSFWLEVLPTVLEAAAEAGLRAVTASGHVMNDRHHAGFTWCAPHEWKSITDPLVPATAYCPSISFLAALGRPFYQPVLCPLFCVLKNWSAER